MMLKLLLPVLFCIYFAEASPGPQIDGRIIGGQETDIVDHPYQASVEDYGSFKCGGAIIARTWILSTASCVKPTITTNFRVRVGTTVRGEGGQLINVTRVIRHQDYYPYDYDIALLQLEEPIILSETAQIIRMPNNGDPKIEGSVATVTGWGLTAADKGTLVKVLREVDVPIMSRSVCADLYKSLLTIKVTDRMICAGYWDGRKDSCEGDAGGPLVIDSVLYGLVSWGEKCGLRLHPGMYTNVGRLRDWITEYTGI